MSVATPVKKIRKRSDGKPQSQINKCNNEKRRRELENDTINQLEELLVSCLTDVRQPDKNGIVQEAAAQIRRALERRRSDDPEAGDAARPVARLPPAPLQHGDVTSTLPLHRSEVTFLVEALRSYTDLFGWALLGINCDGDIECVTDNIKELIKWDRRDLHRQSIYSYLHHGDHQKFRPILRDASPGRPPRPESPPGGRLRGVRSRLLVKPGRDGQEAARYEEVVISATLMREGQRGAYALCVVRREEDLSTAAPQSEGVAPRPLLTVTFRCDLQGKILSCESRSAAGRNSPLQGKRLQDIVHPADAARLTEHLRATAAASCALGGPPTRLRVSPLYPYHHTRPQSRYFHANPATDEQDFIMSTFTILTENELNMLESGGAASVPPVGGPLMTSAVVNGNGPRNGQFPPSPAEPSFSFGPSEFDLEYFPANAWGDCNRGSPAPYAAFPFSPLTLVDDARPQEERTGGSAPGSGPPTPRTPHTPAPAAPPTPLPPPPARTPPAVEPDSARLRNLLSKRESPAPAAASASEHLSAVPATPSAPVSAPPPPPVPAPTSSAGNVILKGLLNQEDEEDPQRTVPQTAEGPAVPAPPSQQRPHGNNMLLRLLNEKSDEEDPRSENTRARSELLSQLLKRDESGANGNAAPPTAAAAVVVNASTNPSLPPTDSNPSSNEGLLMQIGSGGQRSALKRKLMQEEQNLKRPLSLEPQQVSSSGTNGTPGAGNPSSVGQTGPSKLWEKNRMLASLLAKQPSAPTTPLPSPNPHLSRPFQRPPNSLAVQRHPYQNNHALAHILNNKNASGFDTGGVGQAGGGNGLPGNITSLQQMLQGANRSGSAAAHSAEFRTGGNATYMGEPNSDPLLSVILDEVIDFAPDTFNQDNLISLLNTVDNQPGQQSPSNNHHHNSYQVMNEKMAISAIQKSLMQCESAVKSPSSPGVPPAYPNSTQASGGPWPGRYTTQGQQTATPQQQQQAQRQKAQLAQQQAQQQAQQKARLLQAQQQQLVVGAAGSGGGTSAPLHATMDALLNAPTPPNVSLQRTTDAPPYPPPPNYHHHHLHGNNNSGFSGTPGSGSGQDSSAYKLSLQQQNPMLNAQLTQSGFSGQRGSPLAPHTPLTPHAPLSPYLQQPPPRLQRHMSLPTPPIQVGSGVGGFYGGGVADTGYCVEQPPLYPRAHHPHQPHQSHHGNHMSGMTSEYVRQELRAVVGARTGASGVAGGGGGGTRPPDIMSAPPNDLESLGLSFEMPPTGGVVGGGGSAQTAPNNAQKLWETHQNTTSTMEEVRGGDQKSSLLQKLLSE